MKCRRDIQFLQTFRRKGRLLLVRGIIGLLALLGFAYVLLLALGTLAFIRNPFLFLISALAAFLVYSFVIAARSALYALCDIADVALFHKAQAAAVMDSPQA